MAWGVVYKKLLCLVDSMFSFFSPLLYFFCAITMVIDFRPSLLNVYMIADVGHIMQVLVVLRTTLMASKTSGTHLEASHM